MLVRHAYEMRLLVNVDELTRIQTNLKEGPEGDFLTSRKLEACKTCNI